MALTSTSHAFLHPEDSADKGLRKPSGVVVTGVDDKSRVVLGKIERKHAALEARIPGMKRSLRIPNPLLESPRLFGYSHAARKDTKKEKRMEIGETLTQTKRQLEGEVKTLKYRNFLSHMFGYDRLAYKQRLLDLQKLAQAYVEQQKKEREKFERAAALTNKNGENIYIRGLSDMEKLAEWTQKEIDKVQEKINKNGTEEKKAKVQEALKIIRQSIGEYGPEKLEKLDRALIKAAEGDLGEYKNIIKGLEISEDQKGLLLALGKKVSIHPYKSWKILCAIIGTTGLAAATLATGGLALGGAIAATAGTGGIVARRRKIEGERVTNEDMRSIYRSIEQEKYRAFHPEDPSAEGSKTNFFKKLEEVGSGQTMIIEVEPDKHERYYVVSTNSENDNNNIVLRSTSTPPKYIVLDYTQLDNPQFSDATGSGAMVIQSHSDTLKDKDKFRNTQIEVNGAMTSLSPFLPYISLVTPEKRNEVKREKLNKRAEAAVRRATSSVARAEAAVRNAERLASTLPGIETDACVARAKAAQEEAARQEENTQTAAGKTGSEADPLAAERYAREAETAADQAETAARQALTAADQSENIRQTDERTRNDAISRIQYQINKTEKILVAMTGAQLIIEKTDDKLHSLNGSEELWDLRNNTANIVKDAAQNRQKIENITSSVRPDSSSTADLVNAQRDIESILVEIQNAYAELIRAQNQAETTLEREEEIKAKQDKREARKERNDRIVQGVRSFFGRRNNPPGGPGNTP